MREVPLLRSRYHTRLPPFAIARQGPAHGRHGTRGCRSTPYAVRPSRAKIRSQSRDAILRRPLMIYRRTIKHCVLDHSARDELSVTVTKCNSSSAIWNNSPALLHRSACLEEAVSDLFPPLPSVCTVHLRAAMASSNRGIQIGSGWFQTKINLRPQHRGVHLVTEEILRQVPELCQFSIGLCHIQILHTSASLALNESWDPDVRDDMEMMLNKIVPEGLEYRHSCEGPDDMPAHVKACFLGSSLSIPITDGKLALGTWQGIWLGEHRDHAGSRKLVVTLTGVLRDSARSPLSPVSPIASTSS